MQVCILPALLLSAATARRWFHNVDTSSGSICSPGLCFSFSTGTSRHPLAWACPDGQGSQDPPELVDCCGVNPAGVQSVWIAFLILSWPSAAMETGLLSLCSTRQTANLGSTSPLLSRAGETGRRLQLCRRRGSSAFPHMHARKAPALPSPTNICLSFVFATALFQRCQH